MYAIEKSIPYVRKKHLMLDPEVAQNLVQMAVDGRPERQVGIASWAKSNGAIKPGRNDRRVARKLAGY